MPPKRATGSVSSAGDEGSQRSNAPTTIVREQDVLRSLPTAVDDDSPQFNLVDVVVLARDRNEQVNLLHAETEGPFRVRGRLVLDNTKKKQYMIPNTKITKTSILELEDVQTFAVASDPPTIWAAGRAGWYEIQPAPEYEAIYDTMTEAVAIFYTLEDLHTDEADQDRRQPLTPELLARMYREKVQVKKTSDQIKQIFLSHAKFLIGQMHKSTGDVDWAVTPIYAWLTKSAPAIFKLYFPSGYIKQHPSPNSAKARAITTMMEELMDGHPNRRWTVDSMVKAMTYEKLGLKNADQAKEHMDANAEAILRHIDDRFLGSAVVGQLLEMAVRTKLELGDSTIADDDIETKIRERAKVEEHRRLRAIGKTVVDLMHNLVVSGELSVQGLTIEAIAQQIYMRYAVKSEPHAIELIKAAASQVNICITQWGLKFINTPICKDLCWVSQYKRDDEKLDEEARESILRYRDETRDNHMRMETKSMFIDDVRALYIKGLVDETLETGGLEFTTLSISNLAEAMFEQLDLESKEFATKVLEMNAEDVYSALDLKYAAAPLRDELIKVTAVKTMVMDKPATDMELKSRSSVRAQAMAKRTAALASEHTNEGQMGPPGSQPTPRKRGSLADVEMMDVQTPIQRHPAGKGAGKASTRRPIGTPLIPIRQADNDDDDEDAAGFDSPKRRKITELTPNGEVRASVSKPDDGSDAEPEIMYESDDSDSTTASGYQTVVEAVDMGQTEEPNGPDGLWTCEREGCETVIVKADEEEGRDKVRKHFLWHADEIEARYNLVKQAERPYLPVDNLLKHFQKVGQRVIMKEEKKAPRDANGQKILKPLQRAGL